MIPLLFEGWLRRAGKLGACCLVLVSVALQVDARDLVRIPSHESDPVDGRTGIKVHVRIDAFEISPTETTQAEYESVMGVNPSQYRGPDLPVQNVSWWDAIRYCNLRSIREGLRPCYDLSTGRCDRKSNGYRLPTEAEWVLAAGASSTGSALEKLKQEATLGSADTKSVEDLMRIVSTGPTRVASHRPNGSGLYDMFGNVWEWCQNFFDSVISYPQANNPDGPDWGIARVIRGGSFASSTSSWAKGYRSSREPDQRSRFAGFRVSRSVVPAPQDAAAESDQNWFQPYNQPPAGFETSTGNLSSLLRVNGSAVQSPQQWQEHASELKAKWNTLLGACGADVPSPALRVIRTFNEDGYEGTLGALQVEPDAWEDIYIMKPSRPVDHPLPVVIVPFYDVDSPAGKDMGGRVYAPPGVRSFALLAVQRGYIAVAVRWFGESYGDSYFEAVANLEMRHPGCTGMGKWVSDSRQLVTYLTSRADVDSKRIGIIGHSLGGKMALYAAAFDNRIAVTVASEPGIGFSHSNYDDYWYFGKRLATAPPGTDQHELLAFLAPRPFLLIGGDMYDGNDSWHYINAARQVYSLLGSPQAIGFLDHHQGHTPTPEAVWRTMEWFRHFFR